MVRDPNRWRDRAPRVKASILQFDYGHLAPELQPVSKILCDAAEEVLELVPDNEQAEWGLFFLLVAKDAFVRAALGERPPPGIQAPGLP